MPSHRRRRSFPPPRQRPREPDPAEAQIARINELTRVGRTNWFALLAYLTFAFVTVLGVEDADFFIDSRQTQLPLVGVSVGTINFFVFSPILGATLYVYLHLHIQKLAAALAVPEPLIGGAPLNTKINTWPLNDTLLRRRNGNDGAVEKRQMGGLADAVVVLLVWIAGPFVLTFMWTNSFQAHNLTMSSLIAVSILVTLYAGVTSWRECQDKLNFSTQLARLDAASIRRRALWMALPVLAFSFIAAKGINTRPAIITLPATWQGAIPDGWSGTLFAAEPNLFEAQFSSLPADQRDLASSRHKYRAEWCKRLGLAPAICGRARRANVTIPDYQWPKRRAWCATNNYDSEAACLGYFADLDSEFAAEWRTFRTASIAAIDKPDLRNRDLRRANMRSAALSGVRLDSARLEGADLSGAQMEGANLSFAQMEGAYLSGAQMEGADLSFAQMQGADFSFALMEGANFSFAQMEEADVRRAQLEGANLLRALLEGTDFSRAQMDGVNLSFALMEGADLSRAQMEGANLSNAKMPSVEWNRVSLRGALLHGTELPYGANLTQDQLDDAISRGGTILPLPPDRLPPLRIASCWDAKPESWEVLLKAVYGETVSDDLRARAEQDFICSFTNPKTFEYGPLP
ncbi:MAG: pentapeptide repeat-containing protein [Pseudomonadota bacterium]